MFPSRSVQLARDGYPQLVEREEETDSVGAGARDGLMEGEKTRGVVPAVQVRGRVVAGIIGEGGEGE